MQNRWSMLAVLFLARSVMAFQFQSVAALSPLMVDEYGVSLADIGFLIGLYLAPGVVIAIPGGAIAARFGEKFIVGLSMVLMLIGGVLIALIPDWNALVAGRLLAGTGGVVLNVVMTKMLVDWFVGREISTAMAVFVNSWPVGIAIALLSLPFLAASGGLMLAWWAISVLVLLSLVLFAVLYRAPAEAISSATEIRFTKLPVYPLCLAGLIWALYNVALAMVFSFGPQFLTQQGWSLASAGTVTSTFMLVLSIALPLGGVLADRTGRRNLVILVSLSSFVVLMPLLLYTPPAAFTAIFIIVGVGFALAAGPIMTLPSLVLPPESRTFGMGIFFSIYYGVMMIGPRLAGGIADELNNVGSVFIFGAAMSFAAIIALGLFRHATTQQSGS